MSNSGGKPLTAQDIQDAMAALWQQQAQQSALYQQAPTQQMYVPTGNYKVYGTGIFPGLLAGLMGADPTYKPAPREPLPVEHATTPLIAYRTWKIEREQSKTREWKEIVISKPWQAAKAIKQKIEGVEPKTDYFLHSVMAGQRWEGPILRADGKPTDFKEDALRAWDPNKPSKKEGREHPHGIYAYKNGARAMEEAHLGRDFSPSEAIACGRIELFGKVVEHEYGYRAEACRITHLRLAPQIVSAHPGIVEQFSERYQCQVETWNGDW